LAEQPKRKDTGTQKKKAPQKGRGNALESIAQYFKDVRTEFRKVTWPSRAEVSSSTAVVLTNLAFFAILIGILDLIFSRLVGLVIG
jgi:preprotein translocase subunit SecE